MSTMRFADEVIDPARVDELSFEVPAVDTKSKQMAISLIDSLATAFEPSKYEDTYTREVHELIDAKAKGHTLSAPEKADDAPKVIDLMAALQASVEAARQRSGSSAATAGAATDNPAAAGRTATKTSPATDAAEKKTPAGKRTSTDEPSTAKPGAKQPAAKKATTKKQAATKASATRRSASSGAKAAATKKSAARSRTRAA
jgi:DNA end-binding protein Ku